MDGVSLSDQTNYPLVFFNPLGASDATAGYNYKVQLYILDYARNDHYISKEYNIQKCYKIAHDLKNYLIKYKKRVPFSFTINSEFNFMRDKVHGVSLDFDLIGSGGCMKTIGNVING